MPQRGWGEGWRQLRAQAGVGDDKARRPLDALEVPRRQQASLEHPASLVGDGRVKQRVAAIVHDVELAGKEEWDHLKVIGGVDALVVEWARPVPSSGARSAGGGRRWGIS